ncbi:hypothetical protein ESCO_002141 [Escovopsis weberi]|uniref:Gastric mucin-like protein n=1 Tax=Escovopsis weberi TaxID=150374 RepID=A0A0M9VWP6_ESCWE|nr:hypothetical protein ESCO_002141 [Escovopsis weberi]
MTDTELASNGSVVAFEGHPDIVSTQLRLLPTSPQILILPAVQCYMSNDADQPFDVRRYLQKVHDALIVRNDAARKFLQDTKSSTKRLVFMNGGTPSAHALIIRAIMKHETGGDRSEAEVYFNQLIKDGLNGLENNKKANETMKFSVCYDDDDEDLDDELQDPITRAMRAADALDRETANLQPIDMLDLAHTTRPRSLSLPLYGYSDGFGDAAPFFLFGAHYEDEGEPDAEAGAGPLSADTPSFSCIDYNQPMQQSRRDSNEWPPNSPSCIGEAYNPFAVRRRRDTDIMSPTCASDLKKIVSGEPVGLDLALSMTIPKIPFSRINALDKMSPISPKLKDLYIPTADGTLEAPVPRRSHSFIVMTEIKNPTARRLSHFDNPRTLQVRPKRPTIKLDTKALDGKRLSGRSPVKSYVDRGTDAVAAAPEETQFVPLLPGLEDLTVYFKDEAPDDLLSALMEPFKAGRFPITPPSTASIVDEDSLSPTSTLNPQTPHRDFDSISKATTIVGSGFDDDFEGFTFRQPIWKESEKDQIVPQVNVIRPPTPAQTPPPFSAKVDKFHEFNVTCGQTAVTMQNSLRSILNIYFPPEAEGYHQFQFSLLPEFDGLWKPVFRESDSQSPKRDNNRRLDQILAIGTQQGVKKEYSSGIIKQLEKYGTKSSDEQGRSGRLDFRYLLANAMQSFTTQPLASQASDNPFTNSYLLATLIIPHLETYLALHSEIRYLILEYPPEHLPTILALQKLVGVELIKVAQIVDAANKDRLPFTQIGGPTVGSKSESKAPALSPRSSSSDITVSNANFLLTSTATDADIAKFISTVWDIKAEASDAEIPERFNHDKSSSKKKARPPALGNSLTPFSRSSTSSQGGQSPSLCTPPDSTPAASGVSRRASWMEKSKTPKPEGISKPGRLFSRKRLLSRSFANTSSYDPSEDSDLELEERRLMPMFLQKPAERKGNTRKALKFLGLA